jgi:hypothetical protein
VPQLSLFFEKVGFDVALKQWTVARLLLMHALAFTSIHSGFEDILLALQGPEEHAEQGGLLLFDFLQEPKQHRRYSTMAHEAQLNAQMTRSTLKPWLVHLVQALSFSSNSLHLLRPMA